MREIRGRAAPTTAVSDSSTPSIANDTAAQPAPCTAATTPTAVWVTTKIAPTTRSRVRSVHPSTSDGSGAVGSTVQSSRTRVPRPGALSTTARIPGTSAGTPSTVFARPSRPGSTLSGRKPGPSSTTSIHPPVASDTIRTRQSASGACRRAFSNACAVAATRASATSGEHRAAPALRCVSSATPACAARSATRASRSSDGGCSRTDAVARAA